MQSVLAVLGLGLAMLALEGPLRRLTRTELRGIERRLLEMVEQGI
jgi:hypothetical protein